MSGPLGDLGSAVGGWVADVPCLQYTTAMNVVNNYVTNTYNQIDATLSNRLTAIETSLVGNYTILIDKLLPTLISLENAIDRYHYLIQEVLLVQLAPIAASLNLLMENQTLIAKVFPEILAKTEVNLSQVFAPEINVQQTQTQTSEATATAQASASQSQGQVSLADLQANQIQQVTNVLPPQVLVSQPLPLPITVTTPTVSQPISQNTSQPTTQPAAIQKTIDKDKEDCEKGDDVRYELSSCGVNEIGLFFSEQMGFPAAEIDKAGTIVAYVVAQINDIVVGTEFGSIL